MKLLTRYLLAEFFKPFFLSLAGFGVLFLLAQIFQDMHLIMEYKPPFPTALLYFACHLPGFLIKVVPLACLFGVLVALSILSKGNELIAMRAGGVDIGSVALPLLFAGSLIGVGSLLFNEVIVPRTETLKNHTKNVGILRQPEASLNRVRQNLSLVGAEGQMYLIGRFDGAASSMNDILIMEFGPDGHMRTRLDASRAQFENGQWVFYDGYNRAFDEKDNEVLAQPFARFERPLPEKPQDFLKEQKEARELDLPSLMAYIHQLQRNGSDYHKEQVYLYYKFASPFGCIILALLGVPWGWTMRKYSGIFVSFGVCLLVGFVYLGGIEIGQGLGESGVLNPFFSVWIVNILFAILAPVMLAWKNR